MELSSALETAVAAARAAGAILLADFHRPGGARGREDKAEADVEAEREIRRRLLAAFPDWGYLGEETGSALAPGAPVWLVDPNDGTRDYLAGRRGSAVSIGLVAEGRPVLGVVFVFGYPDDAGDLFAWAEGGGPVRRNDRPVLARLPQTLEPHDIVLVSSKGDRDPEGNLECAAPARYRAVASIAHRLALVAGADAAAATSVYAPGAWDYAGGHALLRGAGGVLLDEAGREVAYGGDGSSRTLRAFGASAPLAREMVGRPWESTRGRGPNPGIAPARLRRGEAVGDAALLSRAHGCLLGLVAGGNLGSFVEATADEVPRLLADGGRWQALAGQPSAGGEMALALARSILAADRFDAAAAVRAYREWYRSAPADVSPTTRAALVGYLMADSQAGDPLLRVAPLGLLAHAAGTEAAAWAREDCALTHPNPACADGAAAVAVAVAAAVRGGGARGAHQAAVAWALEAGAAPAVVEALRAAERSAPAPEATEAAPALLADAFHRLLHAESLEAGVRAAAAGGGPAGARAGLAGALLGAVHGRAAVPEQWRAMVLSCRPHPSRARHPRPPACWPVDVQELAERLLLALGRQPHP